LGVGKVKVHQVGSKNWLGVHGGFETPIGGSEDETEVK